MYCLGHLCSYHIFHSAKLFVLTTVTHSRSSLYDSAREHVIIVTIIIIICFRKMIQSVIMKLSEQTDNDSGIMPLNSPGGSTLQWSARRGLLCLAPLADVCFSFALHRASRRLCCRLAMDLRHLVVVFSAFIQFLA